MANPIFESVYPIVTLTRRNFTPSEIADALKVNSGDRDFSDNIMTLNGLSVREGQWVAKNVSNLIAIASSTTPLSWPVWQDPGAGRTDAQTGGLTVLQGKWTVKTNVIELTSLAVQDELVVGALSGGHAILPSAAGGLVRLADQSSGTQHMVVAHVEKVESDGVIITNQNAGYFKAGSV